MCAGNLHSLGNYLKYEQKTINYFTIHAELYQTCGVALEKQICMTRTPNLLKLLSHIHAPYKSW